MVETWLRVQPFHGEGVVSAILVDNFIGKRKKKNLRLLISFGFAVLGTSEGGRKESPKKQEE